MLGFAWPMRATDRDSGKHGGTNAMKSLVQLWGSTIIAGLAAASVAAIMMFSVPVTVTM